MHLTFSTTDYQKSFFSFVNPNSHDFIKSKFKIFSVTGEIDHSITTSIFNTISNDLTILIDLLPSLLDSHIKFSRDKIQQKKLLLSQSRIGRSSVLRSHPLLVDFRFTNAISSSKNEYNFLSSKVTTLFQKLISYMGVYEELYLINTLFLSLDSSYSLEYANSVFSLSNKKNSITFKVFPIFFLTKWLFPKIDDFANTFLLERLLDYDYYSSQFLLTISDLDQISSFFDSCNMNFLSKFVLSRLEKNLSVQLPKIVNISQLPL
jgi:hypothetical protein